MGDFLREVCKLSENGRGPSVKREPDPAGAHPQSKSSSGAASAGALGAAGPLGAAVFALGVGAGRLGGR